MAEEKRKGGGSRLTRSETVTVRLDPKVRYLAELAARKQRRTLSSFIEYAVEQSFDKVILKEIYTKRRSDGSFDANGPLIRNEYCLGDQADVLWDADESERFMLLVINYPDLMSHEEQIIWKVLQDSGFTEPAAEWFSEGHDWNWEILQKHTFPVLRCEWEGLKQAIKDGKKQEWVATTRQALKNGTLFPDLPSRTAEDEQV